VKDEKGAGVNPSNLRYHVEHDWARVEGDSAVFGITDYAQKALGDIVYVELPEVGAEVIAGSAYAEIESVKAVSDVSAPMSGTVLEINEAVVDAPEILNQSPYEDGWLIKVRLSMPEQEADLMSTADYEKMLAEAAE
jgi:glycine cleavage system H protein